MTAEAEMPKYRCHKVVHALKISEVKAKVDTTYGVSAPVLVVEDEGFEPIPVTKEWVEKHKPMPGGYYVVYSDSYTSYSPEKAFEDGYTLAGPNDLVGVAKAMAAALDTGLEIRPGTLAHKSLKEALESVR
jgi:hypothetical protein